MRGGRESVRSAREGRKEKSTEQAKPGSFRAEQAHRKPVVLVVAVVRVRVVRVEVRVPSVGTVVLRARPVVTVVAPVVERTRTGHGSSH